MVVELDVFDVKNIGNLEERRLLNVRKFNTNNFYGFIGN